MKDVMRTFSIVCMALGLAMLIIMSLAWGYEKVNPVKVEHKPVVILPNDLSLMSKYDGDPSLLSAYIRNDSIFLNFEGY